VKVLNALVRMRSGVDDQDGTTLMERVFSPRNPILKFNALADQSDRDEQKGYMMLFSGAVTGLRNPRAHKLIQDDAERALEFIAFVSLLAKLLDGAGNRFESAASTNAAAGNSLKKGERASVSSGLAPGFVSSRLQLVPHYGPTQARICSGTWWTTTATGSSDQWSGRLAWGKGAIPLRYAALIVSIFSISAPISRLARSRSQVRCISSHRVGPLPISLPIRSAISGVTEARPASTLCRACLDTPSRRAARATETPSPSKFSASACPG
jgi:uncharacterized protein (TIGR02391 family)